MSNSSVFSCSFGLLLVLFSQKFLDQTIPCRLTMSGEDSQVLKEISVSGCRLGKILLETSKTQHTTSGPLLSQTIRLLLQIVLIQTTLLISIMIISAQEMFFRTLPQELLISKVALHYSWFTAFMSNGSSIRFSSSLFCLISWLLLSLNLTSRLWMARFNYSIAKEASSTTNSKSSWAVLVSLKRELIVSDLLQMWKKVTEETNGLVLSKTWKKQLVNKLVRSTITSRISPLTSLITKMRFKSRFNIMKLKTLETSKDLRTWLMRSQLRCSLPMRKKVMM